MYNFIVMLIIFLPCTFNTACFANDSGSSISSVLNIENLYSHQVIGKNIILQIGDPYEPTSKIQILEAENMDEIFSISGLNHFFRISSGDNPCIVTSEIVFEGYANVKIFDLNGNKLFSKLNHQGTLLPSPNGVYFYTPNSITSNQKLRVYDRDGYAIFTTSGFLSSGTHVSSFDDSTIVLCSDSIRSYNVFTGLKIKTIDNPLKYSKGFLFSKSSSNGGKLLLYSTNLIALIGADLNLKWKKEFLNESVINTSISLDNNFVATYNKIIGNKFIYRLTLLNADDGNFFWNEDIRTNNTEISSYYPNLYFSQNSIILKTPQLEYYYNGIVDDNALTYVINFSRSKNNEHYMSKHKGIYDIINISNSVNKVITLQGDKNNLSISEVGKF